MTRNWYPTHLFKAKTSPNGDHWFTTAANINAKSQYAYAGSNYAVIPRIILIVGGGSVADTAETVGAN